MNSGAIASGVLVQGLSFRLPTNAIWSGFRAVTILSGTFIGAADAGSGLRLPAVGVTDFGAAGTASGATVTVYGGGLIDVSRSSIETDFAASVSGLVGPLWIVSGGGAAGAANVGRMTTSIPASGIVQQRIGVLVKAVANTLMLVVEPGPAFTSGLAGGVR